MTECGFVAVVERRQENTFFAEGRSAMAGMPPPVFSDRHQTKRKKEKKKKQKEKKELLFLLYIKRYLKDYYIYIILVCVPFVVHTLVHALRRNADSIGV